MSQGRPAHGGFEARFVERLAAIARVVRKYCRLQVVGLENVPAGRALLVANHTGWAGLDFSNLYLTVRDDLGRDLYTAVHPAFFKVPFVRDLAMSLGFFEAGVRESVDILDQGDLVLFFPEGEEGNFKPLAKLYQLQPFKAGFARVALAAAAPIVPVVIVGGEEAHPTLARLEFTRELLGLGLPVPATLLPLPVKWRITFLPPIPAAKYLSGDLADADVVEQVRSEVEATMRRALSREVEARGHPFV